MSFYRWYRYKFTTYVHIAMKTPCKPIENTSVLEKRENKIEYNQLQDNKERINNKTNVNGTQMFGKTIWDNSPLPQREKTNCTQWHIVTNRR